MLIYILFPFFVRNFGEAGPVDSGQVTLVYDDCKPPQAHGSMVRDLFRFCLGSGFTSFLLVGFN